MYSISNSQREEIAKLLAALTQHPGNDLKSLNLKRRAKLAISKLNKSKQLTDGK